MRLTVIIFSQEKKIELEKQLVPNSCATLVIDQVWWRRILGIFKNAIEKGSSEKWNPKAKTSQFSLRAQDKRYSNKLFSSAPDIIM